MIIPPRVALLLGEHKQSQGIQGEIFRTVDEVVRSKKELIRETFPRLSRFMTGYNLAGVLDENDSIFNLNPLLSGSEGTLAFVSEARLKLTPIPKERLLLVVHYGSFKDALNLFVFLKGLIFDGKGLEGFSIG